MSDFYRFPAMADLPLPYKSHTQVDKILEEAEEAQDARIEWFFTDPEYDEEEEKRARVSYGLELMDIIHATETALRMEFSDEEVEHLHQLTIEKNRKRGYYGD